GGNDFRMLMAGIDHGDAGAKIDVALAVLAPDLGVLGALGIDGGRMADAARHGRDSSHMKLRGRWHVNLPLSLRHDWSTPALDPPQPPKTSAPGEKLYWSQRERLGREIRINRPLASRT